MSHTQTVQDLYAAFGRGDVAAILNMVTDEVDWNNDRVASRECPWNGDFSGKARVPDFFKAVDELDIHRLRAADLHRVRQPRERDAQDRVTRQEERTRPPE